MQRTFKKKNKFDQNWYLTKTGPIRVAQCKIFDFHSKHFIYWYSEATFEK